ncbi:MAG: thermonuclease family protein, partial [Blastocatellia bacterium]
MKRRLPSSALILLTTFVLAGHALAQLRSGGEVVEMIDGKTVIVAIPSGRMTIELQHIEVPEPGQQLHESVKEHLKKFLVGKVVEFQPRTVMRGKTIGRLLLNGVDVSQQMLRDGAAWLSPDSQNGQSQEERNLYKNAETSARKELRGVWGVHGLLTAWEYRAEREKIAAQKEMAEWEIYKERTRVGSNASRS